MGYCISQRDSSFTLRKEHFPALMDAAIQRFPSSFNAMSSVEDVFDWFSFNVEKDEQGNLSSIEFCGEKTCDEDKLFELVAPFTDSGSFVEFDGEDGQIWRHSFDGKTCEDQSPLFLWPGHPGLLEDGQDFYSVPFEIHGVLTISAASTVEAREAACRLDKTDLLRRILTMLQENGTARYLRMDKIRKTEE